MRLDDLRYGRLYRMHEQRRGWESHYDVWLLARVGPRTVLVLMDSDADMCTPEGAPKAEWIADLVERGGYDVDADDLVFIVDTKKLVGLAEDMESLR